MSKLTRRELLAFFGSSAAATLLAPTLKRLSVAQAAEDAVQFTPVRLPHPLPIYTERTSFLATGIDQTTLLEPAADLKLESYTVIDDVVVPPEYDRYVIISWGDRVFPNEEDYFGYNNDYTAFVPLGDRSDDGYLWVNHEYVSYPISALAPGAATELAALPITYPLAIGRELPNTKNLGLLGEFLYNLGGSVVRLRRDESGRYQVQSDSQNRRLHGLSGLGINRERTDGYQNVTSWGSLNYQQGDDNYLTSTGPAAQDVFSLSSDGLGDRIIGTAYNCSGGTTPWGTVLSAEENFQASEEAFVGVTEAVQPNGTQVDYIAGTTGATFGLVGEKYGWMVELAPAEPGFRPRKHTALGRFRHENVALRVEAGRPLIAYMGDDRRGGHTYKFVSTGTISSPTDKDNSRLFEAGTLYAARYRPDGTGEWIPLLLETQTNPIAPTVLASVELDRLGAATKNGLLFLPSRAEITGETEGGFVAGGGPFEVTIENEDQLLPQYQGKTLGDFYTTQGAILVDAFLAANLIGATPTARPEDLEVHPRTQEVLIAYTDGAPGSDGYPDSRIFVVSKYSEAINEAQPSGAMFKIVEDSSDGTGTTFRWEQLAKGGEAGTEIGQGFANVDNLAFDDQLNVWGVTDMSTSAHNGFDVGVAGEILPIEHTVVGAESASRITSDLNVKTSNLVGVFGNNFLFVIPTQGGDAGKIVPFAYGPMRCEMTGPTFVGDTLIISVQHPGEDVPFTPAENLSRELEILDLDGRSVFVQQRTISRGSNWPSNIQGDRQGPPKPSVIGITRKQSNGRFI
ncbi:MAG: PhoX family phosphatase [Cyanophyceae cyanobacterium]